VSTPRRLVLAALLALLAVPATASAGIGPDYVSSDNIELVTRLKTVGDGVGGRIIRDGKYLVVTSTKSIEIYDIATDPEHPALVNGPLTMDVEFENEEVPSNGELLGISGSDGCADPLAALGAADIGCLTLWDITDLATPKQIKSVGGAGDHTQACVLDCKYFMGSSGTVVDATDPANAKIIGNWIEGLGEETFNQGCHHQREVVPGIILASCQPTVLISIRPEDGGSVLKPVLMATAANSDDRFVHSSRWPRDGDDKFMLSGGETNASPQCDDTVGAFMVWDASAVGSAKKPNKGGQFKLLDEVRPVNGTYADGHTPVNGLGCSVHWFQEHPQFHNGGAVALAEYENGTRVLQITPQGKVIEQGYFLPLGGSTSSPFWNPNGKVIYAIDYARGIDVLRYTGPSYAPDNAGTVTPEPGATPGTGGAKPGTSNAPACASAAGFEKVSVSPSGSNLRFGVKLRQQRAFDISLFQLSSGRTVLDNRLRARATGLTASKTIKPRNATDGFYFARLRMRMADGGTDTRRLTLIRKNGRFRVAPDFYQRTDCGVFRTFKLSSAAFGGRSSKALGIAYRLARGAKRVRLTAKVGSKVVKTFTGGGDAARTYRFTLPAKLTKRGAVVKVTAKIEQSSPIAPQTLTATHL